jgi:hypothetical protein
MRNFLPDFAGLLKKYIRPHDDAWNIHCPLFNISKPSLL